MTVLPGCRRESQLGAVHVGDRVGDGHPVACAGLEGLLDLNAVRAASGEPVHDVSLVVTAEPLVPIVASVCGSTEQCSGRFVRSSWEGSSAFLIDMSRVAIRNLSLDVPVPKHSMHPAASTIMIGVDRSRLAPLSDVNV